eukprot:PRCOL_00001264-RA
MSRRGPARRVCARASAAGGEAEGGAEDLVPQSAEELLRRARRHKEGAAGADDAKAFEVLEKEPSTWRELEMWGEPKEVYVLGTQTGLFTLRTRRADNKLKKELGKVLGARFTRRGENRTPLADNVADQPNAGTAFKPPIQNYSRKTEPPRLPNLNKVVRVSDIRQGVLVFEDEEAAEHYAKAIEDEDMAPRGDDALYVAAVRSGELFDVVRESKHLAVVFRRGTAAPIPSPKDLKMELVSKEDGSLDGF